MRKNTMISGFKNVILALCAVLVLLMAPSAWAQDEGKAEDVKVAPAPQIEEPARFGADGLMTMGVALGYARVEGGSALPNPQHGVAFQTTVSYEHELPGANINVALRPQIVLHDWSDFQGVDYNDLTLVLYTADMMVLFPRKGGHVAPYIFVGGGVAEYNIDIAGVDTTDTSGVFEAGVGFRGAVGESVGLYFSPEITYLHDGTRLKGNNLRFTVGMGMYFE